MQLFSTFNIRYKEMSCTRMLHVYDTFHPMGSCYAVFLSSDCYCCGLLGPISMGPNFWGAEHSISIFYEMGPYLSLMEISQPVRRR